ncbi:MAG: helix-turn-helix transcriptional regulator [bacterium]|nr:helix-turn-helix transcriptional regulator [bacterium]
MGQPEKIAKFRERVEWTTTELAGHLGISQAMVSSVENGSKTPSLPVANAWVDWAKAEAKERRVPLRDVPTQWDLDFSGRKRGGSSPVSSNRPERG